MALGVAALAICGGVIAVSPTAAHAVIICVDPVPLDPWTEPCDGDAEPKIVTVTVVSWGYGTTLDGAEDNAWDAAEDMCAQKATEAGGTSPKLANTGSYNYRQLQPNLFEVYNYTVKCTYIK